MSILTKEELKALTTDHDGWCVSIFMPTYQAGAETQQNPIRLKNLLSEAETRLQENGLRPSEAEALLESGRHLLEDSMFWQHQSNGLALFFRDGDVDYYRVPLNLKELVILADRFYVKPLLPLVSGDGQFYVLALSQKEIRLLQGTRDTVTEVDLEVIPDSIDSALWFEDPERRLQFHTSTGTPGARGRPAVFYGHGVGTETDDKETILRYFQRIDKGLRTLLGDEEAPMVLAGVDYLLPLYQEANTYPHLIEDGITGSPENLSAEELHSRAWEVVKPFFMEAQKEAANQYNQLAKTERASSDIKTVILAAYRGRVGALFVALDQQKWGNCDLDTNTVELHEKASKDSEDLLDVAAVQTLMNGGTVYAVDLEDIPEEAPVAAIFRY